MATPSPGKDAPSVQATEGRRALGRAVQQRAPEVAAAVVNSWQQRYSSASEAYETLERVVTGNCQLGTELIGRYLATGQAATPSETARLAESSTTVVVEDFPMTEVIKNNLTWRDETLRVLREEASRIGVERDLTAEASAMVRLSGDHSLVGILKQFDGQMQELEARLAGERAKLTHLALHDSLTGLANRTLLLDRLGHAIAGSARRSQQVGVLYLDLDGFKAVNDTLGHAAGDRLLVAVAERLTRLVRPADTVARLGGDEFVVVCDDLEHGEQALASFARRVQAGVTTCVPGEQDVVVAASIGATIADAGDDPERALARADAAMYAAKSSSRPGRRHLSSVRVGDVALPAARARGADVPAQPPGRATD